MSTPKDKTMRLVVDTNQAAKIVSCAPRELDTTIVLPPLVWAEILVAPSHYHKPRIEALAGHKILFGMDVSDVYDALSGMGEDEIREFDPVVASDTTEHVHTNKRLSVPPDQLVEQAKRLRSDASKSAGNQINRLIQYKKRNFDANSRNEQEILAKKFDSIQEAESRLMIGDNAPLRDIVVNEITRGGDRSIRASSLESLYRAILDNAALRRFLRLSMAISLGYGDGWADSDFNICPSEKRNDLTDMTLPLFARDGDTILTSDGYLRRMLQHIDPERCVNVSTWEEYVKSGIDTGTGPNAG